MRGRAASNPATSRMAVSASSTATGAVQLPVAERSSPTPSGPAAGQQVPGRLGERGQRGGRGRVRRAGRGEEDRQREGRVLPRAEDQRPGHRPAERRVHQARPGPPATASHGRDHQRVLGAHPLRGHRDDERDREVADPHQREQVARPGGALAPVAQDRRQPGQRRVVDQRLQAHEEHHLPGERVPVHRDRAERRHARPSGAADASRRGRCGWPMRAGELARPQLRQPEQRRQRRRGGQPAEGDQDRAAGGLPERHADHRADDRAGRQGGDVEADEEARPLRPAPLDQAGEQHVHDRDGGARRGSCRERAPTPGRRRAARGPPSGR